MTPSRRRAPTRLLGVGRIAVGDSLGKSRRPSPSHLPYAVSTLGRELGCTEGGKRFFLIPGQEADDNRKTEGEGLAVSSFFWGLPVPSPVMRHTQEQIWAPRTVQQRPVEGDSDQYWLSYRPYPHQWRILPPRNCPARNALARTANEDSCHPSPDSRRNPTTSGTGAWIARNQGNVSLRTPALQKPNGRLMTRTARATSPSLGILYYPSTTTYRPSVYPLDPRCHSSKRCHLQRALVIPEILHHTVFIKEDDKAVVILLNA